jgi:hypothetical protein
MSSSDLEFIARQFRLSGLMAALDLLPSNEKTEALMKALAKRLQ